MKHNTLNSIYFINDIMQIKIPILLAEDGFELSVCIQRFILSQDVTVTLDFKN